MSVFSLVGLLFGLAFPLSILFWGYIVYRYFMLELGSRMRKYEPVKRYLNSCLLIVLWGVGTWLMAAILLQLDEFGRVLLVLLGVFGFGGWIFVLIGWLIRRGEYRAWRESRNDPKWQVWMQDLVVSIFLYGLMLAIMQRLSYRLESSEFVALAVYLFSCTGLGLYTALDVARYSRVTQRAGPRTALIAFSIGYALIFSVIAAWMAWRGWRLSRWWSWDRLKHIERIESESPA